MRDPPRTPPGPLRRGPARPDGRTFGHRDEGDHEDHEARAEDHLEVHREVHREVHEDHREDGDQAYAVHLRRREHPGPGGPRAGPQATRHVHRHHQQPRPAPPRQRGRRQRDRRGDGRLLRQDRRDAAHRRLGERHGQRPRHPGQADPRRPGPPLGARGRPHRPARGREVRRRRLRHLGRSARRRRLGRERALGEARGRGAPRRCVAHDGVRPRQGHEEAHEGQGDHEDRDTGPVLARPRGLHRDPRVRARRSWPSGCRSSRS